MNSLAQIADADAIEGYLVITTFVVVQIYLLSISALLSEIFMLPLKAVNKTIFSDKAPITSRQGNFFVFLILYLAGVLLWFMLAYLPIHLFSAKLNSFTSYRIWFAAPLLAGLVTRKLFFGKRNQKRSA